MSRSQPGYPVDPNRAPYPEVPEDTSNARAMPPPMPPPAPSRRRAQLVMQSGEDSLPPPAEAADDLNRPTVDVAELEEEPNPFKSKSRWRSLLKKPSREFSIRGGIALLSLAVGIGVGAKPWKSRTGNAAAKVVATHAVAKKPSVTVRSAQASHLVKPAPYRAATVSHIAATKPATTPTKPAATPNKPAAHAVASKTTAQTSSSKQAPHAVSAKSTK